VPTDEEGRIAQEVQSVVELEVERNTAKKSKAEVTPA
jgi:acetate kinase